MANQYSVKLPTGLLISEILAESLVPDAPSAAARTITYGDVDINSFNGGTVPAITLAAQATQTLTGGTDSIDLTAIAHLLNQTVDATGYIVIGAYIEAGSDNDAPVTVADGATNGAELLGADFTFEVAEGRSVNLYGSDEVEIDATHKTIDVSGTVGDVITLTFIFAAVPSA